MALITIFEEQTVEGFEDTGDNSTMVMVDTTSAIVAGETYKVLWDGTEVTLVAADLDGFPILENEAGGFAIQYVTADILGSESDVLVFISLDAESTSHTVGIYQVTSDDDTGGEEEGGDGGTEEEQEGIILKDRNGNNVAYYGIETVTFDTTTEGKQQKYTKGVKAEKTVELSLANGDQTVEPDEGTLLSKVIIQRPDSLQPEIILSGHDVAGVPGAYVPITTEEKTVDLDFSEGDITVEAESGKAFSKVSIPVPENLAPENIAEGMYVAGIGPGTHSGGGGSDGSMDAFVEGTLQDLTTNASLVAPSAFVNNSVLTNVYALKATDIGASAFLSCIALKNAQFPEALRIGSSAFASCASLTEVSAPKATTIDAYAFQSCAALETANMPEMVSIGLGAFYGCSNLQSIYAPKATSLGANAFYGAGIQTAELPAFEGVVPNQLFYLCENLSSIEMSKVTAIGTYAFNGCTGLQTASFPEVSMVSSAAFRGCKSLSQVYFPKLTSISGSSAFQSCALDNTVRFSAITQIPSDTFAGCTGFTELTSEMFPAVTSVSTGAFRGCTNLTRVDMTWTNTSQAVFSSCINLSYVNLPKITTIPSNHFRGCYNLQSISIPNVTTINNTAFYQCSALSVISLPQVSAIASSAFQYCSNLMSVYLGYSGVVKNSGNSTTFVGTPMSTSAYTGQYGSIYVPNSLYSKYISNTYWSYYSARLASY